MTERSQELHATADRQITGLIDLVSRLDETALRLPCPGRAKLGDGTVGASVRHTADNYQRIAAFVQTSDRMPGARGPAQRGGHRMPRLLRAPGHGLADHAEHGPGAGQPADEFPPDTINLIAVAQQLTASRDTLARIVDFTDSQLEAIPPKDSFRFCDGQRTLEQVLASLLKHQSHQVAALETARA